MQTLPKNRWLSISAWAPPARAKLLLPSTYALHSWSQQRKCVWQCNNKNQPPRTWNRLSFFSHRRFPDMKKVHPTDPMCDLFLPLPFSFCFVPYRSSYTESAAVLMQHQSLLPTSSSKHSVPGWWGWEQKCTQHHSVWRRRQTLTFEVYIKRRAWGGNADYSQTGNNFAHLLSHLGRCCFTGVLSPR